jgi:general secretion pathway protein D
MNLNKIYSVKLVRLLFTTLMLLILLQLVGCAGMQSFREGQALLADGKLEQGLAKLEEAVKLEPKNAEYRITLSSRRASIVSRLISAGEIARREGRLTDAEKNYRQVQTFEVDNVMARQGILSLQTERRHRILVTEADILFKKGTSSYLVEALDKLRPVLIENPNQKDALYLKERIEETQAKAKKPESQLAEIFRKPISLEFRDTPLKSLLEVVSKVSGLNFFYDRDIRPDLKATVFAKNTTIEDAIRLLLVTNQLEQKILNENSILIYPSTAQKLKEYQTLAVRSFYLTNADVKSVSNTLKTIVKTKDLVTDERLGIIIMRDTPEAIRIAERIVALQDISDPEVMLEVEIVEIKRARLMELGVQWPSQLTLSPLKVDGVPFLLSDIKSIIDTIRILETPQNLQASIGNVVINARKEDQDGNILANPRIRVKNKEKAKVQIGDRVPVITTTSTSAGFVSESVNYVDVGLKLEVEPTIYLDEEVSIKINLEVSNLVRETLSKSGTLAYQIGTRGVNTVLRLKDGETQILAGLISDEERSTANKVPLFGELPIAGRLFGNQKDDSQRSEILLSITPRIVRSIRRPSLLASEFDSGTENSIGSQSLKLSYAEPQVVGAEPKDGVKALNSVNTAAKLASSASSKLGVGESKLSVETSKQGELGNLSNDLNLIWQAPKQVKVGEQFSAVLKVQSHQALKGIPLLIGFDPQVLQVVSVQEGDFFKQGNRKTNFNHRVDVAQGKIFVAMVRQSETNDSGINGIGGLATVSFKAIKGSPNTKLQLLSATPEPPVKAQLVLPMEQVISVVP